MANFSTYYTPQYKLFYRSGGIQHVVTFRGPRGEPLANMSAIGQAAALGFFVQFEGTRLFNDFAWISAQVRLEDTNVFVPAAVPATLPVGTVNAATTNVNSRAMMFTASGRSNESKGRIVFQGLFANPFASGGTVDEKWYITRSEEAAIDDAIAALISAGVCGPDGTVMAMADRVTLKHSDALLKEIRKGIVA